MRLVSTLAAGIAQAANGTAVIYKRGTSTDAQYWNDFEGDDPVTLGTVVDLDAYGSAVVYVNELVNVLVYDSGAQLVREFVDANAAPNTEVRSLSFTGQDYTTGAFAPGNPTTLQAVLDLWKTNSLAVDWKVEVNGVVMTIPEALAGLVGIYYNVKNPNYAGGAVGDGVNDDGPAIEAAIADAAANGGGVVFFPAGDYRVISTIEVPPGVSLLGTGSSSSSIVLTQPAVYTVLDFPGTALTDSRFQSIAGLRIYPTREGSDSPLISFLDAWLEITGCSLGNDALTETGPLVKSGTEGATTSARLTMSNTVCYVNGSYLAQASAVTCQLSKEKFQGLFENVEVIMGATSNNYAFWATPASYNNCVVDFSASANSGAAFRLIEGGGTVTGCTLKPGSVDVVGINPPANGSPETVVESGNDWGFNSTHGTTGSPFGDEGANGIDTVLSQGLRTRWRELVVADTAAIECEPIKYGVELIHKTGTSSGGAQTVNLNKSVEGHEYTLMIWNNSGGTIEFTINDDVPSGNIGSITINTGQVRVANFVCMSIGTASRAMVQTSAWTASATVPT